MAAQVLLALAGAAAFLIAVLLARRALARPPAESGLELVPISGPLGLVEVRLTLSDAEQGAWIVQWRPNAGTGPTLLGPLLPGPLDGPNAARAGRRRWSGRFEIAPAEIPGLIEVEGPGGVRLRAPLVSLEPDPKVRTPDWAKGTVWYQILPERFRNGNPLNDPSPAREPLVSRVLLKPWRSAWSRVPADELEAARDRHIALPRIQPAVVDHGHGLLYEVIFARRYGGDLQGVVERLDELRALGVDSLYLTPVFRAASLHKYDAADHRHIDDTLGDPTGEIPARWHEPGESAEPATWTWTRADRYVVDTLIPEVRRRGMRLIFDGVWNHTGPEHFAFADVRSRGSASPYAGWFRARFVPDPKPEPASPDDGLHALAPGDLMNWKGWGGRDNGGLPVFLQTPQRDLVAPVKQHVFDVTRRWMDPGGDGSMRGVDGWRLDVAPEIGTAFWSDWRAHVKSINPDALLIAEIWRPAGGALGSAGFDGQMNYPFARAVVGWLGQRPAMSSDRLARELEEQVLVNHPAIELVQMNLLGSHDTDRIASMLMNPGREYDAGGVRDGPASPPYIHVRPTREAYDRSVMGVALQACYAGSPMIYYGDELGVWGADDPDNRKPMPWEDLGPMEDPADAPEPGLRDRFAAWLLLRRDPIAGRVLRFGGVHHLHTGKPGVFAFQRQLGSHVITVVANRDDEATDAGAWLNDLATPLGPDTRPTRDVPGRSVRAWVVDVR